MALLSGFMELSSKVQSLRFYAPKEEVKQAEERPGANTRLQRKAGGAQRGKPHPILNTQGL